jgi:hypothetical protein
MTAKAHPPSLPGVCPRPMVDLGTLAGLRTRDHKLTAYCPPVLALDRAAARAYRKQKPALGAGVVHYGSTQAHAS